LIFKFNLKKLDGIEGDDFFSIKSATIEKGGGRRRNKNVEPKRGQKTLA